MHKYKVENSDGAVERDLGVIVNHILNMSQQHDANVKIEKLILGHFNRCVICKTGLVIFFLIHPLEDLVWCSLIGQYKNKLRKKKKRCLKDVE